MLGLTYDEIVSRLSVDPSTVWRAVQRFEEHGTVDSCYTHEGPPKKLTALVEFIILEAVINRPAIHLCEIHAMPGGADNSMYAATLYLGCPWSIKPTVVPTPQQTDLLALADE